MKTYGTIIGSIALIFCLLNFQNIVKGIFGADAVANPDSLGHTIANIDLVAYLIYASLVLMPIIILTDKSLTKDERERIIVIFILAFFVIFFWACFEQAGASLTLFADQQVDREINVHISRFVIAGAGAVLIYCSRTILYNDVG